MLEYLYGFFLSTKKIPLIRTTTLVAEKVIYVQCLYIKIKSYKYGDFFVLSCITVYIHEFYEFYLITICGNAN